MEFNPFEVVQHILRSSRTKFCSTTLSHFGSNGEISAHLKSCWVSNVHLLSQHFVFHKTARAPQVSNLSFFGGPKFKSTRKQANKTWDHATDLYTILTLLCDWIRSHDTCSLAVANVSQILFLEIFIGEKFAKRRPQIPMISIKWHEMGSTITFASKRERERDMDAKCLQIRTVWFSADKVALPIILLSPSSLWLCRRKAGRGGRWVWRRAELEKKFTSQMDVWFMF